MTLAKAGAKAKSKTKHFYSTGFNYDFHLRSSKYFYSTGHRTGWSSIEVSSFCDSKSISEQKCCLKMFHSYQFAVPGPVL